MLLARVIIGIPYKAGTEHNRKLKRPPLNIAMGMEYDSVEGMVKDTTNFMVYASKKCYPAYLITYELP